VKDNIKHTKNEMVNLHNLHIITQITNTIQKKVTLLYANDEITKPQQKTNLQKNNFEHHLNNKKNFSKTLTTLSVPLVAMIKCGKTTF